MIAAIVIVLITCASAAGAWLWSRALYGARMQEFARDLGLERERVRELQREADALGAAMRRVSLPPAIAALVVQRYRIDVTCPNCHGLAEQGQSAFCLRCDYEHEYQRRDAVVRAAVVLVGHRGERTLGWEIELANALRAGGWIHEE